MYESPNKMAQNWILMISELRRYQGVSYKSDITVISGSRLEFNIDSIMSHLAPNNSKISLT